jgi:flagellar protein FliO/FliZ
MNKKSFSVWLILVCMLISFSVFAGGDEAAANISNDYLQNPSLSDDSSADVNSDENSEDTSAAFGIWNYIKVLLSLVFVLGLLIFVLKFINKKNVTYQKNNMLQNLGGISVGQQKSVQIVKIGKRILVVGVGEDIQVLADIEDEAEIEHLVSLYEDQFNQSAGKPHIAQVFSKFNKSKATQLTNNDEQPFSQQLNERLSEIKKERSEQLGRLKGKEFDDR